MHCNLVEIMDYAARMTVAYNVIVVCEVLYIVIFQCVHSYSFFLFLKQFHDCL
jgi:hypothetical protein